MTDSEKLDLILSKFGTLETEMQEQKQRIANIEKDVSDVKSSIGSIESDVSDIRLTLENEIRVNIQRIAEGHLDLSRKLNESIRLSNDIKDKQEIQDIYINMHHNKLKAL